MIETTGKKLSFKFSRYIHVFAPPHPPGVHSYMYDECSQAFPVFHWSSALCVIVNANERYKQGGMGEGGWGRGVWEGG